LKVPLLEDEFEQGSQSLDLVDDVLVGWIRPRVGRRVREHGQASFPQQRPDPGEPANVE